MSFLSRIAPYQKATPMDLGDGEKYKMKGRLNALFQGVSFVKPIRTTVELTQDVSAAVETLNLRADVLRGALGLPTERDTESKKYRDVTGDGHLFIRGALASLDRIARGENDASQVDNAIGTINFLANPPEGKSLPAELQASAKIAKKILEAEKAGIRDIRDIAISGKDIQRINYSLGMMQKDISGDVAKHAADIGNDAISAQADLDRLSSVGGRLKSNFARLFSKAAVMEQAKAVTELMRKTDASSDTYDIAKYKEQLDIVVPYYQALTNDLVAQLAKPKPTLAQGFIQTFKDSGPEPS